MACAAFDTKVVKPNLPGSAGKAIDKELRRLGGRPVAKATTFRVHGKWDGLADGELDRARDWGAELARGAALTQPASAPTRRATEPAIPQRSASASSASGSAGVRGRASSTSPSGRSRTTRTTPGATAR